MFQARHRILALLAAAAGILFLFIQIAPAQDAKEGGAKAEAARDEFVKFIILHTNDIHGQLLPRPARGRANEQMGGAAAMDTAIARERAAAQKLGAKLLLIDSGDWYQGTPEGNFTKDGATGTLMIEWMNRAGFDAAVIGNHEFDFGVPNVMALLAKAKFPILGANILLPVAGGEGHGEENNKTAAQTARAPIARPYVLFEHGGVKLAIIGLLTADTPRMVAQGRLGDITIPDEYEEAKKWLAIAKKEADIVLLATHCGNDIDKKMAGIVPEVPVILGGHSHTFVKQPSAVEHEPAALARNPWKPGRTPKTYILQSGSKAENLDRIEITIDPKDKKIDRIETRNLELYIKEYEESVETKKWIAAETAPIAKEMDTAVAEVVAPAEAAPKGRKTDPTGNLATQSMLWRAKKNDPAVSMAFNNSSGIRSKIATGPLTKRQIYEVLPFDNTIVIFTLKGSELLAVLGEVANNNGRPLTAGLEGTFRFGADGKPDASQLRVDGKPFSASAEYRIAANSFIAGGKGGYTGFEKGRDTIDTGLVVRDALLEFAVDAKKLPLDDVLRLKVERGAGQRSEEPEPAGAGAGNGGVKK